MTREAFRDAAGFLVDTVTKIPGDTWDTPALGEWTMRDLVGHASRALRNVEMYSADPAESVGVQSAAAYFVTVMRVENINASITERGRQAGQELGDNPAESARQAADRSLNHLDTLSDNLILNIPLPGIGGMRLADYLSTRTLELTIHTLDISNALGVRVEPPESAISVTMHILADVAVMQGRAAELALAATGRISLPQGFNLLG